MWHLSGHDSVWTMFVCHTLIHISQNIKQMKAIPILSNRLCQLLINKKNDISKSMAVIYCYQTFQPWTVLDDEVNDFFYFFFVSYLIVRFRCGVLLSHYCVQLFQPKRLYKITRSQLSQPLSLIFNQIIGQEWINTFVNRKGKYTTPTKTRSNLLTIIFTSMFHEYLTWIAIIVWNWKITLLKIRRSSRKTATQASGTYSSAWYQKMHE